MEPTLFFSSPPDLGELCSINVFVPCKAQQHSMVRPQIVKCRSLIFTEQDVLASPSLDLESTFTVVMQRSLFTSGRVQNQLRSQECQLSSAQRVHPHIYQSCLRYTVLTKLSPLWNKAGDWLIQGRDFLSHRGYANAIQMTLCVNKDEIYVSLLGAVVRSPPLEVEDLDLSQADISRLMKSSEENVPNAPISITESWCHVLPSMKKGLITSLALTLPSDCPFKNYRDIRSYWKNMYGYRLPDNEETCLYYQVRFLPDCSEQLFTYPNICLRGSPIQRLPRVDHKPILQAFLQDLHRQVDSVCGRKFRFQPKLRFPVTTLHSSQYTLGNANLSSKSTQRNQPPNRTVSALEHLYQGGQSRPNNQLFSRSSQSRPYGRLHQSGQFRTDSQSSHKGAGNFTALSGTQDDRDGTLSHSIWDEQMATLSTSQNSSTKPSMSSVVKNKPNASSQLKGKPSQLKGTPGFSGQQREPQTNSTTVSHNIQRNMTTLQKDPNTATSPDKIPHPTTAPQKEHQSTTFGNKVPQTATTLLREPRNTTAMQKELQSTTAMQKVLQRTTAMQKVLQSTTAPQTEPQSTTSRPTIIPTDIKKRQEAETTCTTPHAGSGTEKPKFIPLFRAKAKKQTHTPVPTNTVAVIKPTVTGVFQPVFKPAKPQRQNKPSKGKGQTENTDGKSQTKKVLSNPSPKVPTKDFHSSHSQRQISPKINHTHIPVNPIMSSTNAHPALSPMVATPGQSSTKLEAGKRKQNEENTVAKKARTKPQLQTDVDIEALAGAGQLNKVNAVTLTNWLKERGIACKAKDKKGDLLTKVNLHLGIGENEP